MRTPKRKCRVVQGSGVADTQSDTRSDLSQVAATHNDTERERQKALYKQWFSSLLKSFVTKFPELSWPVSQKSCLSIMDILAAGVWAAPFKGLPSVLQGVPAAWCNWLHSVMTFINCQNFGELAQSFAVLAETQITWMFLYFLAEKKGWIPQNSPLKYAFHRMLATGEHVRREGLSLCQEFWESQGLNLSHAQPEPLSSGSGDGEGLGSGSADGKGSGSGDGESAGSGRNKIKACHVHIEQCTPPSSPTRLSFSKESHEDSSQESPPQSALANIRLPSEWEEAIQAMQDNKESMCEMKWKPLPGYGDKLPPDEWPRATWDIDENGKFTQIVYYESKDTKTGDDSWKPEVTELGPDEWREHVVKVYRSTGSRFFFRPIEKDTTTQAINADPSRATPFLPQQHEETGTPCPNAATPYCRLAHVVHTNLGDGVLGVDGSPAKRTRRASRLGRA